MHPRPHACRSKHALPQVPLAVAVQVVEVSAIGSTEGAVAQTLVRVPLVPAPAAARVRVCLIIIFFNFCFFLIRFFAILLHVVVSVYLPLPFSHLPYLCPMQICSKLLIINNSHSCAF